MTTRSKGPATRRACHFYTPETRGKAQHADSKLQQRQRKWAVPANAIRSECSRPSDISAIAAETAQPNETTLLTSAK